MRIGLVLSGPAVGPGPVPMLLPAAGGVPHHVFEPRAGVPEALNFLWSPDGRTLYYKAHDAQGDASFWAVSAAGGVPRMLVHCTNAERPSSRGDFATDGKRFYFAIEDRQSDVFVAEMLHK